MSLYGSLSIGINSLLAQGNRIGVISDNISNSNTVGYKDGVTNFADLIANDTVSAYSPAGATAINSLNNFVEGDLNQTQSPTDLAISGNGFFPVSQNATSGGDLLYTRAGSFTEDKNGNLVNSGGFFLQGWKLDANGQLASGLSGNNVSADTAIASLVPVNIQNLIETPIATTTVDIHSNLDATTAAYSGTPAYDPTNSAANMASGAIAPSYETPFNVVDSTGVSHNMEAAYLKTGTNTWAMEVFAVPASDVTAASGQVAAGTLTFNTDGSLASVSPSLSQISINWQNGAAPSSIALDVGTAGAMFGTPGATVIGRTDGITQYSEAFNNDGGIQQNGVEPGTYTGVTVTTDGTVVANYSNGTTQDVYKIPLATFINADQLNSFSSNVFQTSVASGTASFDVPAQGGAGTIQSDTLEASNVDLTAELTNLVVAQNAYQSSSKLVSTTDTMLSDLVQMGAT